MFIPMTLAAASSALPVLLPVQSYRCRSGISRILHSPLVLNLPSAPRPRKPAALVVKVRLKAVPWFVKALQQKPSSGLLLTVNLLTRLQPLRQLSHLLVARQVWTPMFGISSRTRTRLRTQDWPPTPVPMLSSLEEALLASALHMTWSELVSVHASSTQPDGLLEGHSGQPNPCHA